jgi:hypothetical protein
MVWADNVLPRMLTAATFQQESFAGFASKSSGIFQFRAEKLAVFLEHRAATAGFFEKSYFVEFRRACINSGKQHCAPEQLFLKLHADLQTPFNFLQNADD